MFEFKFSIIIIISGNEKNIQSSIDSILSQSIGFKDNVEIIQLQLRNMTNNRLLKLKDTAFSSSE